MVNNAISKHFKYVPKAGAALSNFVMLVIALLLFLGRTEKALRWNALLAVLPDLYQHASNLCISYLVFAGIGFMWLLLGLRFGYIIGLGIALIMGNFVCEVWVTTLNTPDILDAFYGFFGTIIAFLFLAITKRYGLTINEAAQASA